jgi:group I intron endonuclease
MYIYLIVNHVTGKYYVGQHKGADLRKYLQQKFGHAKRNEGKGGSYLYASMRKHGREAFTIHALLSDIQTRPELDAYEKDFIAFLKSQDPEYGYNICRGGEGFTGPHTEQWKEKMRVRMKGRTFSPEAIARMKASPKTEVQLANLKKARLPETIARMTTTKRLRGQTEKQKQAWQQVISVKHNSGLPVGYRHSSEAKKKMGLAKVGQPAHNTVDMIGQVFNGIEVLERAGSSKSGKALWSCRCCCGSVFVASGDNLRNRRTKSGGCDKHTRITTV